MDVQIEEIGMKIRKYVILTIKWCFRSVCNHPFLVCLLCFFFYLYRSSPFVFSLLVSASPVLVCTAVLLGTLLSFGQPNIPEIEIEHKISSEGFQLKTGVLEDPVFVEKNESCLVDRWSDERRDDGGVMSMYKPDLKDGEFDGEEDASRNTVLGIGERSCEVDSGDVEIGGERRDLGYLEDENRRESNEEDVLGPLIGERSRGVELSDVDIGGERRGLGYLKEENRTESNEEDALGPLIGERSRGVELSDVDIGGERRDVACLREEDKPELSVEVEKHRYEPIALVGDDEHIESDAEKSEVDSFGSEKVNVDSLDSPPRTPWTRVGADPRGEVEGKYGEDDGDDDDDDDSGSDRAESSSPDASMADILPMLDELHPLLDVDNPQPAHLYQNGFDDELEGSVKSNLSSHGSDSETEDQEDLDVGDDDNDNDNDNDDDDGDEEDGHGEKEENSESAITWTEEDQKNLMDLGSLEIERNLRLENLILRRRAKKNPSTSAERNLIDLESLDFPFNIAPISTRRQNPFDLPHDSNETSGLPPIPGSAPSVLLARRNPFDIPYDSGEEKPDLMRDEFQEEFTPLQPRDPFFSRHESFNLRPSLFAPDSNAGKNVNMRPYFVPEQTISEESSYSRFQRQSSALSDSKVDSLPETGSTGSFEDLDDRKLPEEDNQEKIEMIDEAGPSQDSQAISPKADHRGEDPHWEPELPSITESVAEHVGHGDQSSDEEDSLELGRVERTDFEDGELNFQSNGVTEHYQQGSVSQAVEVQAAEYHPNSEDVEQRYSTSSSSSSLSEVSERVFIEAEGDNGGISAQNSVGSSELSIMSTIVNVSPHREPVYDLSPHEDRRNLSSSPLDVESESDPLGVRMESVTERELDTANWETEMTFPSTSEAASELSISHPVDDKSRPIDAIDTRDHDTINTDVTANDLLSVTEATVKENLMEEHGYGEALASSGNVNVHSFVELPEEQNLDQLQEDKRLLILGTNDQSEDESPSHQHRFNSEDAIQLQIEDEGKSVSSAEGQASSDEIASSKDDLSVKESSIPKEIPELDRGISSNVDSLIPDFISFQSNAFQTSGSLVDEHTIIQEVDEIKEVDEGLLSELDTVGDFSVNPWGSSSTEFVRHRDYAEESLCAAHYSGTGSVGVIKVDSIEKNKIEDALPVEGSRELQTPETSIVEKIGLPLIDLGFEKIGSKEIQKSDMPDLEVCTVEDIDLAFNRIGAKEIGEPVLVPHSAEVSYEGGPDIENPGLHELEACTTETIDQAFEKIIAQEIESTITNTTLGMPQIEARTIEDIDLAFKVIDAKEIESPTDTTLGMPEFEARKVEDINLAFEKIISEEIEAAVTGTTSGMPQLEARTIEDIDLAFKVINAKEIESTVTGTSSGMPQLEASTIEDIDLALKIIGAKEVESTVTGTTSGMPQFEASTIEDIDLAFKVIGAKESELAVTETSSGMPQLEASTIEDIDLVFKVIGAKEIESTVTGTTSGMPQLEASTIEDIDLAFKVIGAKEVESTVTGSTSGLPQFEASTVEDINLAFKVIGAKEIESTVIGTTSGMPELEASTIEDIDRAFKVIGAKEIESTVTTTTSGMPELEASTIEDIHLALKVIGAKENESTVTETTLGMPELEASMIEDIHLAFKVIGAEEIEMPVSEPREADTGISGMPRLEARNMEDIDLASKSITAQEIRVPISETSEDDIGTSGAHMIEDSDIALKTIRGEEIEADKVSYQGHLDTGSTSAKMIRVEEIEGDEIAYQGHFDTGSLSGMLELEARTIEDITLAFKESGIKEIEAPVSDDASHLGQVNTGSTSVMPEVEVRAIEDIDLAFEETGPREIGTPVSGQVELGTALGMPGLEARTIEDINQAFKTVNDATETVTITEHSEDGSLPIKQGSTVPSHEASVLETVLVEDASDTKQLDESSIENPNLSDSVDHAILVVESEEKVGTFSEATTPPPNKNSDEDKEEQLKPKFEDSNKVQADEDSTASVTRKGQVSDPVKN